MNLKETFRKLMDKNSSLKWISLGVGITAWFLVVAFVSPDYTTTITQIPVKIDLDNSATGQLGLKLVEGENTTVEVVVRGKRYAVGNLTPDDFNAVGAITNVKDAGTYSIAVNVSKKTANSDYTIVSTQPLYVSMRFDWVITKEFTIEPDLSGIRMPANYIADTPILSGETVSITGPKSEVESIAKVTAKPVKDGEQTETQQIETEFTFLDYGGDQVNMERLATTLKRITVTVPILEKKTVNLTVAFGGVPEGFDTSAFSYTMSTDKLTVAGIDSAVSGISSVTLGTIELSQIDAGSVFTLPLTLPDGIKNLDGITQVKVSFSGDGLSKYLYRVTNLNVINAPAGVSVSMLTKAIYNVTVVGKTDIITSLSGTDLVATADLSGMELINGNNTVPVKITIPGKGFVWAVGSYTAVVKATR